MPFLTAPTFGDVEVTIIEGGVREFVEVGDTGRALDGSYLSTVRARKKRVPVKTAPMTSASADSLYSAITATPPLTFSGDVLGASTSCFVSVTRRVPVVVAGDYRWVLEFVLEEA